MDNPVVMHRVEVLLLADGGITCNYSSDTTLAQKLLDMGLAIIRLQEYHAVKAQVEAAHRRVIPANPNGYIGHERG